jgi:esterase/lipase
MMMIEDFKDINNSLKEIQETTGKRIECLKEETQKSLKELQENTIKQVKEMNKTIQDLKIKIETIQLQTTLGTSSEDGLMVPRGPCTPQVPEHDQDLRITGEWNTTSVPNKS